MILLTFVAIVLFCAKPYFAVDSPCGSGWEPYSDEKCIKIFNDMLAYDDAMKACHLAASDSSLLSIRSAEEQEFMTNFLFKTHKVENDIWLGAKISITNPKFTWATDNAEVHFTNWASGKPSHSAEKACVQLTADDPFKGKWADEPCTKKNLVVCQKPQNWTIARLQQTLLDTRKELRESLEKQRKVSLTSEQKLQSKIDVLEKNPVPINFIYVQLAKQPEPKTLWPSIAWSDVTTEYAGVFFRAEGGGAAAFGQTQSENTQRLVEIQQWDGNWKDSKHPSFTLQPGQLSPPFYTGNAGGEVKDGLLFRVSGGEVRPRNMAMRIWKRTA